MTLAGTAGVSRGDLSSTGLAAPSVSLALPSPAAAAALCSRCGALGPSSEFPPPPGVGGEKCSAHLTLLREPSAAWAFFDILAQTLIFHHQTGALMVDVGIVLILLHG